MQEIFNRRSVRRFTEKTLADDDLTTLLKAAMRAPSAGNEQPWEFVVLREREAMVQITGFHPYATMLKEAAACVVVCGNTKRQKFDHDYWVQDCSAAVQNMLLAATGLGLGSVWLGMYPEMEGRVRPLQKQLGLPRHVVPLAAVALGWPAEEKEPIDTYKPERVHYETWG